MVRNFFYILFLFIGGFSCTEKPDLIQNRERLADVQRMLSIQKEMTSKSLIPIWDIFNQQLSPTEKQAMEFLYAYMPLSDLADYPTEFFLKNVQYSLKSKAEMPWGKTVPEDEFLHFVLPLRVNNENLDNFREVMYTEIKERIKGLSMKDAALEINHWCHEKVNYRGTDARTSAPLSTVKKTFGRCGEESTFTVSAMRTAGIPARQVYTPRWAHTDDNHAWVEVWIDGKWYYLGACEPDVDLNMGWFTEPSKRVMLVHTRAYGKYFGTEEVLSPEDRFSELNLTPNYALTKKITILVKNSNGLPVDSARVEFQLYNYAEYFPIATGVTDDRGYTGLTTGLGDLVIWAAKNGRFAYQKISVPGQDTIELILQAEDRERLTNTWDLVPPHAVHVDSPVSDEARKTNDKRLAFEDSVRNSTMSTFRDSAWVRQFSARTGLPFDSIYRFISLSYGNWDQISAYLETNSKAYRNKVLELAIQLSDKDYSDATESVLSDHLRQINRFGKPDEAIDHELFNKYVLSPRIANENLSAWRSFLADAFGREMGADTRKDISVLTNWMHKHIRINTLANKHSRTPISPKGVYNLGVADAVSRDIFFVAACRTFGIPARLNPETQVPEYYKNGLWHRAEIDREVPALHEKGQLKLLDANNLVPPQYYLHYTIGYLKDGFYRTLEFPEGAILTDREKPIELEAGKYSLITGNRLQDGTVLSRMEFFSVEKGKLTIVPVQLRKESGRPEPKGKLVTDELKFKRIADGETINLNSIMGSSSSVWVYLDPENEPSKHVLNDLGLYLDHFNKWNGQFIFVIPEGKATQAGAVQNYRLPAKSEQGIDHNDQIINAISVVFGSGLKNSLPLVLFCDSSGNVYYFSSGYKIGIGEQILRVISALGTNHEPSGSKASCSK